MVIPPAVYSIIRAADVFAGTVKEHPLRFDMHEFWHPDSYEHYSKRNQSSQESPLIFYYLFSRKCIK